MRKLSHGEAGSLPSHGAYGALSKEGVIQDKPRERFYQTSHKSDFVVSLQFDLPCGSGVVEGVRW